MKKPEECRNMEDIRAEIDLIDNKIVELISQRAQYVYNAAKFKKDIVAVRDENRVAAVIDSKRKLAQKYGISPDLIGDIYEKMINFFVNEEIKRWEIEKTHGNMQYSQKGL